MFTNGWWLILIGLVPAILLAGAVGVRRRRARLTRANLPAPRISGRSLRLGLWTGAAMSTIIALANPVWGIEAELIEARGTAVVLVMDVSASMDTLDLAPSRLERAKIAAIDILRGGEGNLFGLVLFAGESFVRFPLSSDILTAEEFIQTASSSIITRQGTVIEEALRLAIELVDERISGDAMIVLMTDGEDQSGDPLEAADFAVEQGIAVHVIGYGTPEGDVIPVYDPDGNMVGVKADSARNVVISQLDEPILQEIADRGGGTYQRASVTGVESVAIINAINELEAGRLGARLQTISVSRYGVFVALALLLLTAEFFIRESAI